MTAPRDARRIPRHRRGPAHLLRQEPHPARRVPVRGTGRGGGSARAQRRRQEHDAQDHHGPRQPEPGQGAVRGQGDHRHAGPQDRTAGHRLRSRGPAHLQAPHRHGEPAHRPRPPGRHRGAQAGAAGQAVRILPAAGRAAQPGRRHAVGRRAADAGHRQGHDARAQDHPAGRADRRADAAHGLADQGDHRRTAQGRCRDPAGGAKRAAHARSRASASTSWRRAWSATTPSPRSSK